MLLPAHGSGAFAESRTVPLGISIGVASNAKIIVEGGLVLGWWPSTTMAKLGRRIKARYLSNMTASSSKKQTWVPHPDDVADVNAAIADADAGRLLSPAQSEQFLAWLEGTGEKPAWLDESE